MPGQLEPAAVAQGLGKPARPQTSENRRGVVYMASGMACLVLNDSRVIPARVLEATPPGRWHELDLAPTRTIEFHLDRRQAASGRGSR